MTEKPLHKKTISEIYRFDKTSSRGEIYYLEDLKNWAVAMVKDNMKFLATNPKGYAHDYNVAVNNFLIHRFEIKESDLK